MFDLSAEQIDVVILRQSVVHPMVDFTDGAIIAQLIPPEMWLPIQYSRFPALRPGARSRSNGTGGTAGAVPNAANEAAVAGFLDGQLNFTEIVPACRSVRECHNFDSNPTLADLLRLDDWDRKEIDKWVCT